MKGLVVKLLRLLPRAQEPHKGTQESAYYDVYAAESYLLGIGETKAVTTGWRVEIPNGWFLDIRPRSGLALGGVVVSNSPGVIDADFRGEWKVILTNHSPHIYQVNTGDRIAQCALMPIVECEFVVCSSLSQTERGEGGYGSTGR